MDKYVMDIRIQEWSKVITEANTSGKPKKEWLLEHGITKDQFYYWQNKVRKYAAESLDIIPCDEQPIVEVPIATKKAKASANTIGAVIHIGTITIDVSSDASSDFLLNLGRMIKNAL